MTNKQYGSMVNFTDAREMHVKPVIEDKVCMSPSIFCCIVSDFSLTPMLPSLLEFYLNMINTWETIKENNYSLRSRSMLEKTWD